MRQYFVGIDVSKRCHTAAVVDEDGQLRLKDFDFTDDVAGYESLLGALGRLPEGGDLHVCLEATGNYAHRLAAFLRAQPGFTVSVVNARSSHHFAKVLMARTKTDRVDAVVLARYARALRPRATTAGRQEALARLTRSRRTLQLSLIAQVNQLRNLLERVNPGVERGFHRLDCGGALAVLERYATGSMLARARPEKVAQLRLNKRLVGRVRADRLVASARSIPGEQGAATDAVVVRQLVAAIRQLQRSLAALEETIAEQVRGHLLFTIDGLGPNTVPVILAESPVDQLDTDTQAMAFAGLNPRLRQSGRFAGKVKLSKCGPAALRHALYLGAVSVRNYNPVLRQYYLRKLAEGKRPNTAIIACMSKLLRIIFAVLKTGRPFDSDYETNRTRARPLAPQAA